MKTKYLLTLLVVVSASTVPAQTSSRQVQVPIPKTAAEVPGPVPGNTMTSAITFAKGQIPPVKGFWSLTLYNDEKFFHPNPLNRFALGTKNKTLKYAPDGSLTLYLGSKSPGQENEANWLPAPAGNFSLILRLYWPEASVLGGTWGPPQIKTVN